MKKILVADDDDEMRRLLSKSLTKEGYEVSTACDGGELLARLHGFSPDLVISDIQMPGKNGLQALAELKLKHPDLKVILITAFGDARTHARAEKLGAWLVFDKPFDVRELKEAIRNSFAAA